MTEADEKADAVDDEPVEMAEGLARSMVAIVSKVFVAGVWTLGRFC